jgi:hypothetical protein
MTDDKPSPKQEAAQRLQESLRRVQEASHKANKDFPGKGGKGPKPASPKGRMFRHQGR